MSAELDPFEMLYCDSARCRVDTFERGRSDEADSGCCPACGEEGLPLR